MTEKEQPSEVSLSFSPQGEITMEGLYRVRVTTFQAAHGGRSPRDMREVAEWEKENQGVQLPVLQEAVKILATGTNLATDALQIRAVRLTDSR